MNRDRDQYITEVVLGECWHKFTGYGRTRTCKCGLSCAYGSMRHFYNNFSDPSKFIKLWNKCKEKDWWGKFCMENNNRDFTIVFAGRLVYIREDLIHPDRFADAVYEFLKERRGVKP